MNSELFKQEIDRIRKNPDSSNIATTILETEKDERGWIPCMVKEGEMGYYRTDWRWCGVSFEEAKKLADERNQKGGLSAERAEAIIFCSMFKGK